MERKAREGDAYFGGLNTAVSEDLLHHLVLVAGAELVLKLAFAGSVEDALLAVPGCALLAVTLTISLDSLHPHPMEPTAFQNTVGRRSRGQRTQEP